MTLFQLGKPSCGRAVAEGAMSSREVVVGEPAGKSCGAFGRVRVDRAVGPAALERLDEALGLAVGPGPVGLGEEVPEPKLPAGLGVHVRSVAGAVVAHHALDPDPHGAKPLDGSPEEVSCGP